MASSPAPPAYLMTFNDHLQALQLEYMRVLAELGSLKIARQSATSTATEIIEDVSPKDTAAAAAKASAEFFQWQGVGLGFVREVAEEVEATHELERPATKLDDSIPGQTVQEVPAPRSAPAPPSKTPRRPSNSSAWALPQVDQTGYKAFPSVASTTHRALGSADDPMASVDNELRPALSVFKSKASDVGKDIAFSGGVQVWPEWLDATEARSPAANAGNEFRRLSTLNFEQGENILRSGDMLVSRGTWRRLMIKPSSKRKVVWDILSFGILAYDVLTIPLAAFEMPDTVALTYLHHAITSFWTMDIICNFLSGFYDNGILELRPRKVALKYLKSWFAADLFIVSTDWIVLAIEDAASSSETSMLGIARLGKTARVLRILRLLRLLRLLKVVSMLEKFSDVLQSESLHTSLTVLKLVGGIVVVNHFIACGWFAVGNLDVASYDTHMSWVEKQRMDAIIPLTLGYKYSTSLHWSLTQFTPASMEVVPKNSLERMYSILVILLALVMFSSFVSTITSSMTHLRVLRETQRQQSDCVRQYIGDNKLSLDLSTRLQAFIRQNARTSTRKRVHERDIPAFKFLPEHLRMQLHCEVYMPKVLQHPLFQAVAHLDYPLLTKLCHTTVGEQSVVAGEELFKAGHKAQQMYILNEGVMEYCDGNREGDSQQVSAGRRISEIVLWSPWDHQGRLVGVSVANLTTLDSPTLRTVIVRRPGICARLFGGYALAYIHRYVGDTDGLASLSDIWEDWPCTNDIVDTLLGKDEEAFSVVPARDSRQKKSLIHRIYHQSAAT